MPETLKKVSVIVPVYNIEKLLPRCLDSLRLQTLQQIEVLLIDDASTDASASVAAKYAKLYPEVFQLVRQPCNQGPAAARNAGLAAATGEYVGFVDSDDSAQPEMFERMYELAQERNADVVLCGERILEDGEVNDFIPIDSSTVQAVLANAKVLAPVWNKLFRRSFLLENKITFPKAALCSEDMAFNFKAMAASPVLAVLSEALYNYHITGSSISFDLRRRIYSLEALRDIRLFLKEKKLAGAYKVYYRTLMLHHALYYPACLLCIDSLLKGHNRLQNMKYAPLYLYHLGLFLAGK